jgi:hypothetical protein
MIRPPQSALDHHRNLSVFYINFICLNRIVKGLRLVVTLLCECAKSDTDNHGMVWSENSNKNVMLVTIYLNLAVLLIYSVVIANKVVKELFSILPNTIN